MTSWQLLQARISCIQRACASVPRRQPKMRLERLPLGTAVGPPGAARLKPCVRTLLYVYQHVSGEAPPRRRTNADCLKIFRTRSKLIYEEAVCSTPNFVLAMTLKKKKFSEKTTKFLGNNLWVTIFPEKIYEISENVIRIIFAENSWPIVFSEISLFFWKK